MFNAERFAEQTYANLKDIKNELNQESEVVAHGAYNLADVISRQYDGHLIKANKLARECLRIRTQIFGLNNSKVGMSCSLLAHILQTHGKLGDETKELSERSLATSIRNEGPDGMNTSIANMESGRYHCRVAMIQPTTDTRRTQLLLAKSYYHEAVRIETKIHSPTHPHRVEATSLLSDVVSNLSRICFCISIHSNNQFRRHFLIYRCIDWAGWQYMPAQKGNSDVFEQIQDSFIN